MIVQDCSGLFKIIRGFTVFIFGTVTLYVIQNNTNVSYDRVVQLYDQSNALANFAVRLMTDYFTEDELTDNVS